MLNNIEDHLISLLYSIGSFLFLFFPYFFFFLPFGDSRILIGNLKFAIFVFVTHLRLLLAGMVIFLSCKFEPLGNYTGF